MRDGACARWRWSPGADADGVRSASMVGSASLKVQRGSRQAPPWTKLAEGVGE